MSGKLIKWSVFLVGATAMASQIIFLREFLVIFKGNELSIGIILANWLIWGAFGGAVCGKIADRFRYGIDVYSFCQFLLAASLLVSFLGIRMTGDIFGSALGEISGYPQIFIQTFILLSVPCALMGFLFSLGCRIYNETEKRMSRAVTTVYILEALGALFGGLLAGYFLLRYLPLFIILSAVLAFNLINVIILVSRGTERSVKTGGWVLIICSIVSVLFLSAGGSSYLDKLSFEKLWKGFDVLAADNSVYGSVTLTKQGDQISFYENGMYLYTVPDKMFSEETVHYNLLQNNDPTNILIIGGGIGGSLEELLKYDVSKIDYLELDPLMIEMARKYAPDKTKKTLADPRVNIVNQDGRYFIKRAETVYDSVIINVGDPYNAQVNRFYTVEFFREISKILKEDGIVTFSLTSDANYISEESGEYLRSIYLSAKKVFDDILVIPGDTAIFVLSKNTGVISSDPEELLERKARRGISTLYVEDYYLLDKMSAERIGYAESVINTDARTPVNRDFSPVSYYFSIKYWSTQLKPCFFSRIFSRIRPFMIWAGCGVFLLSVMTVFFFRKRKRTAYPFRLAVMTTGFSEIIFQLSVIIAFQVIYGFVYQKIAVIFTSFMAGLAFGGWIYYKYSGFIRDKKRFFRIIQILITVYPLFIPLILVFLSKGTGELNAWLGSNIIIPFLPLISGIIGGLQFPAANDICLEYLPAGHKNIGKISGINYGMDLLGASFGALVAASVLIPIIGIIQTCILTSVINLAVLFLLFAEKTAKRNCACSALPC